MGESKDANRKATVFRMPGRRPRGAPSISGVEHTVLSVPMKPVLERNFQDVAVKSPEESLLLLQSSAPDGLLPDEAARRLEESGRR